MLLSFCILYKNVDIKFIAQNTFLESPSSGTSKVESLENQIVVNMIGSNKTKGPKQDKIN
jgi:hypothetical protein